jgi:hypothetical protein
MPTAEDFRRELFQMMANAQKNGRDLVPHPVTDSKEREGINAELCSDSELALCQQHK